MKIQPVSRKTLADIIAGKLAASIFDETLPAGSQLPAERDLIQKLEVSRTTLREALKILEEQNIIESRAGVGWFVKSIDEANFPGIYEYASLEKETRDKTEGILVNGSPGGPKRLPTAPEKPIHIPNLRTDRLGTFNFISWWEREKVRQARVLVIGAGALGNEVVKNLALMGVGYLYMIRGWRG